MTPTLYWIEGPWKGRLAIAARPRGNDWLAEEVKGWRQSGVDVAASLLTSEEVEGFGLNEEAKFCRENGIAFITFPIPDRNVPKSYADALNFVRSLEKKLAGGKTVAVHCRQGLGRAAMISAGLLVLGGLDPEAAIHRVSSARACPVPETAEQSKWIARLALEPVHTQR